MNGGQGRHLAARGLHGRALSVLVSMRPAYLAVLRVLGWLALPAGSCRELILLSATPHNASLEDQPRLW